MKQWICIEDRYLYPDFYWKEVPHIERIIKKGEIFWVDKFEYQNGNKHISRAKLFEESPNHVNERRYVFGLPNEIFENHFMLLSEWRENQLNTILK